MKSSEAILGRTFVVSFEHGKDFFSELEHFCTTNDVKCGYIPMFIAGFKEAELVGTCERLDDPNAPVWTKVYLNDAEVIGGGTIAFDEENGKALFHIHVSVGLKPHSATAHTSHLLNAKVQFLVEMIVVEIVKPRLSRVRNKELYDIALLTFS